MISSKFVNVSNLRRILSENADAVTVNGAEANNRRDHVKELANFLSVSTLSPATKFCIDPTSIPIRYTVRGLEHRGKDGKFSLVTTNRCFENVTADEILRVLPGSKLHEESTKDITIENEFVAGRVLSYLNADEGKVENGIGAEE